MNPKSPRGPRLPRQAHASSNPQRTARHLAVLLALAGAVACSPGGGAGAGAGAHGAALETLRDERLEMGTRFEIQLVTDDVAKGRAAIDAAWAEIERLEALLSEWRETSEISEVNRQAGRRPVRVGPELLEVMRRSAQISEITGGAFDATFAGCGHLWSFRDGRIPDPRALRACLRLVDYRRVELDAERSTIFLPDAEMRIGIAGIGKGYGIDRAAEVLESLGFQDYVVDGGGDIRLSGTHAGRPWRVGIADPRHPSRVLETLEPGAGAIVTSGDYENYFERDGVRYHHILDPTTGRPARASVAVTVIAPNATEADALATGLFVMGAERGLALVERLPGVEALIFDPAVVAYRSSGFPRTRPVLD